MKNLRNLVITLLLTGAAATAVAQPHAAGYVRPHSEVEANKPTTDVVVKTGAYTADWNNLSAWECPEWFRDAKFGIWAHWDPQCEAEDGDWYARSMYGTGNQRTTFYNYFGHYPDHDWGYKDFCRYWTIANWDPAALIDLYYAAGARYFMAMGQHHDNYDCWNSPYQEWNSMNIGPKRDVVGEWAAECRRVGMKVGVSMHGAHAWTFFEVGRDKDTGVTKEEGTDTWWEGYDPQELYAQNHDHSSNWSDWGTIHNQWDWGNGVCPPSIAYMQKFQNRILQCINDYDPDMLYFDDTVLPFYGASTNTNDQYSLRILQHFYNHSAAKNGGQQNVVVCGKKLNDTHKAAMLWDIERGTPDRCQDLPWQTCTCLGGWHYSKYEGDNNMYKSAETVIRMLVDIVSKNGNLLLSVPVRGDGTIDNNEKRIVNGIKAWMDINSESIHGTRPWKIFGEGPAAEATYGMNGQGFNEGQSYTSSDVRYVTKNGKVYATIMAWPAAGDYRFKAFGITSQFYSGTVTSVKLLGAGDVPFTFDGNGLTVQVPSTKPNSIAPVFEITLGDTTPAAELNTLIPYVKAIRDATHIGQNSGNYTQAAVDALSAAITTAENATSGNEEAAVAALRTAFANFETNGQVPGGNLDVVGTSITTDKLVEASNFSATNMGNRFGTPVNWTVENFSIPTSNGTKNGIDNYPGYNCLMIGRWAGEDGTTTSDLTNSRIYRKISLPAGHYFFGASYNANYQLGNAYIFVASSLLNTDDVPSQAIAYHNVNQDEINSNYYGVEFYLDAAQEIYLGWQVDLTSGSTTSEFRAQSVELLDLAAVPTILDAKQCPLLFIEDHTVEYLKEASAFADNGETTRFRSSKNWVVENYEIDNGGNGVKKGIDRYPGYNCLQLGRWNESASAYDGVDLANSRIYQQVTLPAGTYFFGAEYEAKEGNCDEVMYMFASKTLVNTADIENVLAGCRLKNTRTNSGYWGFTFTLDQEETLYLGWQGNSSGTYSEFRVRSIALRQEGTDQGVLEAPWTQETAAVPANTGNYFFVLKDYPQDLIMVSKAGANQGGSNKTMWYTAGVDPSTNKDALWVFDTDGEYQIITSATYPDVMFQTDGQWNYRTQNNGGGDLSWGRAKFALTENGWTVQNGRYGGENYLGPWDGEGAFADNKEVAMNKGGAAIGHFDLFSIPRGLYVKNFEDVASASAEHPIDLTYIVSNPGAERYNNNKVYSWVNGSEWNAEGNGEYDGLVGSRYFERQTSANGDATTVASDIYQEFTDLPKGYYRFSATALGGENLKLYANDITVTAPSGTSARVNVIAEVTTAGTLRIGARAYNVTDDWVKFDDVKLEYLYRQAPTATLGVPTWSVTDGGFVQGISSVTVSFPDATDSSGKNFAVVDASKKITVTIDGVPSEQAISLDDKTITISLGGEVTAGHEYTITIPAGAVGFQGIKTNEELTISFKTPKVLDGTYYLYNAQTGKYLAPSGGEVHVTAKGTPIVWQMDNAGNSAIKYWNRSDYVTGRWWAENGSAMKFYIEDPEEGFEGFKIRKTNPEDNPWYYLYVSGERVATNGRHTSTGDGNFSDWAYAHWQFIPAYFYERTASSNNFGTICLPREACTDAADIYSIASITENTLSLEPLSADEWMEAGKPYIFKATGANPTFTMKGDAVTAPIAATGLVGTFTEITAPQGASYFVLNDNKLYNVDYDGVTVGENRAYIDVSAVPTSTVKGAITLELVGYGPTTIETLAPTGRAGEGLTYDLVGRRIHQSSVINHQLPRGVYIINGNKVVVK